MKIKFYSNLKDDLHCLQAGLKMVLSSFGKHYSFKELDKITGFKKWQWTWSTKMLIWLSGRYEVMHIERFNYAAFAERGENYLKRIWDKDFFTAQKAHSDFRTEQGLAKKLLKSPVKLINRYGTIIDIEKYFGTRMIMVTVNSAVLNRWKGYFNHVVVLTNVNEKCVSFHDPGLPAKRNWRLAKKTFMKAMYDNATQITFISSKKRTR